MSRRPSRKFLKRERRAAARHGMTVEQWRDRPTIRNRGRRRQDGYADHEQWRQEVDGHG